MIRIFGVAALLVLAGCQQRGLNAEQEVQTRKIAREEAERMLLRAVAGPALSSSGETSEDQAESVADSLENAANELEDRAARISRETFGNVPDSMENAARALEAAAAKAGR